MKIEKYSEFNKLNESFWGDVKYGLSKLGRYKAGGKILGKKDTDVAANQEIDDVMSKQTNILLKSVYDEVKKVAPEFPNDRKKITFLRGVIMYGQLYDSLVAAAKKDSSEDGYLAPDVCNEIIEDMRKVVKKFLDVDLKAVYTVAESKDVITKDEMFILNESFDSINEEEEIIKKLTQLKDKAMDKLFGAKKGSDAVQKTTKGQSAKLQKTSGETNVESERMKTLQSNKLPIILSGVGGALGALGWIVQTDWFKDLITTTIKNPARFEERTFTDTIEKNIKVDSRGWSYTIQNNGFLDSTGKSLNFNQPVSNLKDAFKFYGGGDLNKGIEAMSHFLGGDSQASSVANITKQLADPSNKTVGDIFNHLEETWGDKVLMNQNGGAKSYIAKLVYKQTKKVLVNSGVKTVTSALGAKLVALGPVLSGIGISLIAAGAVVKLLREKGQRQSRAKTLNDLLQSLVPIQVGSKNSGDDKKSDDGSVRSEKSIYPLMIKNLTQLRSLIASSDGVKLEVDRAIKVGNEYIYTNKKGEKKRVKVISLTHDTRVGNDKRWLTSDDTKKDTLQKGSVSVIFKDKSGQYSSSSPEMAVRSNQLKPVKESNSVVKFKDMIKEDKTFGKQRNVEVTKSEDYLTQAVTNIRKSLKSLKDEKDKGIGVTYDFITAILDKKMDSNTKEPVKQLYAEVYDYLYGTKASTLGEFPKLYNESVEVISNKGKRQVVAEKMARFSKRSLQFEGEGFYGGMGEFGSDLQDWNKSFKEIMSYFRAKSEVNESKIFRFRDL